MAAPWTVPIARGSPARAGHDGLAPAMGTTQAGRDYIPSTSIIE